MIYFIQADKTKMVKIGYTASDCPKSRRSSLQTGSAENLILLATIPDGDMSFERDIHERFSSARLVGEWFSPCDALFEFINEEAVAWERQPAKPPIAHTIAALGNSEIRKRLGVGQSSISNAITTNKFPSSWFDALDALGREKSIPVPRSLFNWRKTAETAA